MPSRRFVLARARANIARYENAPGHLFQSATESSYDTWIKFFTRSPNLATTTISYYDKGAALGLLLDLATGCASSSPGEAPSGRSR